MKKYLFLFSAFALLLFASCSDDDDNTADNSIVGTWTLVSVNPPVINLNCPQPSTLDLMGNGTAEWELYDAENECALESSTGTWEKNSGDSYTIYVPNLEAIEGTVKFQNANSFTFTTSVMGVPAILTFNRQI
ncbi:lipocalin family protein [Salinimicrobium sp. TH3]|uniref:lipocalin family protein n=1 Tax=Salinimicrobium sp. TH3 TaxID=2997342 RepID=UPI0022728ED8|nr:lipocalin family protein [Salinimicrobium sp. TH3]MCY2687401.1 lipocalin family protein [Salinimicrobium sp. TH3]